MRMVLEVSIPNDPFNAMVREGTAAKAMQKILESNKPQGAYFMEVNGLRTGILIVELSETSQIPKLCEPWFLTFNAQCRLRPCMTPEDLAKSGIDQLGKAW